MCQASPDSPLSTYPRCGYLYHVSSGNVIYHSFHYGQGSIYTHTWKVEFLLGQVMAGSFVTLIPTLLERCGYSLLLSLCLCKLRESQLVGVETTRILVQRLAAKAGAKEFTCLSRP